MSYYSHLLVPFSFQIRFLLQSSFTMSPGCAEIYYCNLWIFYVLTHENILQLDISMYDSFTVQVANANYDLSENVFCDILRNSVTLDDNVWQLTTNHMTHDKEYSRISSQQRHEYVD